VQRPQASRFDGVVLMALPLTRCCRTDPSPGRAFGAERGEQIARLRGGHAEKTVVLRFGRSLLAVNAIAKLVNPPTSNVAAALCNTEITYGPGLRMALYLIANFHSGWTTVLVGTSGPTFQIAGHVKSP
jgi:hypothetical protein